MESNKSRIILSKKDKSRVGWKQAIAEARGRIEKLEAEASQLKMSVRIFEDNEKLGVPFPGA